MNLVNGQFELWVYTGNGSKYTYTIIALSNCGRLRRKSGAIEYSKLRQLVAYKGKLTRIYRVICEHFIPRTEEDISLGRNVVDHLTHYPKDISINDIRNMRWCTNKENSNFAEARRNMSKAQLNKPTSEFGHLYIKKYGYSYSKNVKQYLLERKHYLKYGSLP